jgi:peptidoglycan glycosyltransferase
LNKQISAVALGSLVLLASLIVATTYWQTWASGGLAAREDNAIQRVAQFEIRRGLIYASDGKTILAENVREKASGQILYFRKYPTNGFASQTIGYSTESSLVGLEHSENAYLTGTNQDLGTFVDSLGDQLKGTTISGNSLVLNLDVKAQRIAESLLRGKCGAAVALNPQTGAVSVMASAPTFNPNLVAKAGGYAKIAATKAPCSPSAPLLNRATQGLYPPGSTFKTITAAAALDDKVYTPTSMFNDPGYCTEYGKPIYNADDQNGPEVYGNVTLAEAYQHSINAVFCQIGMKLGAAKILDEAKRFGFYSVPPLELPSDARSASGLYDQKTRKLLRPKDPNTDVDPGRLAFGQERMLVTPLQMGLVAATIANGGVEMKPQLVKKVVSRGGSLVSKSHPEVLAHPTSPATAAAIKAMMISVVQAGTGEEAQIPGVVVAGKTGTAETGVPHVYDAWFIFFAPAVHPVVAGAVVVENQPNGFGGAIAAPIAKAIMQAILPQASKAKP